MLSHLFICEYNINISHIFWRRHPDSNRGSKLCRLMPYHLAMSPKSQWCPKPDLNRYGKKYRGILSPLRLPFRHPGKNSLNLKPMERETRFELATPTLARLCSTPELFPHFCLRNEILADFCLKFYFISSNFKIS